MRLPLHRAGNPVTSVFGLRGSDENDLSAAVAYALYTSDAFLKVALADLEPTLVRDWAKTSIHIQAPRRILGITDIELLIPGKGLIVIEAKKGSALPGLAQLRKYARICRASGLRKTSLVPLTTFEPVPGQAHRNWKKLGIPVRPRSWRWARHLVLKARRVEARSAAKRVLADLQLFLEGFLGLERAFSNMVYVVSLGSGYPQGWTTSWIDVVERHGKYFYPAGGKGWPPPPNYLAFRYRGQLQSVHHVESYRIVDDLGKHVPGAKRGRRRSPHYLFQLGPAIRPPRVIKPGPRVRRSARVWCMLDALLTSRTVSQALTLTKRRRARAERYEPGAAC